MNFAATLDAARRARTLAASSMMKFSPFLRALLFPVLLAAAHAEVIETDVLVFGATAGVVSAACPAPRRAACSRSCKFTLAKGKGLTVTLSNRDTDGFVVADGILLRRIE